jgi:glutamate-1-semialdehyde 2,1-aminomutase
MAKRADTKKYAKFFQRMLAQGIYFPPAQFEAAFVSYAHDKKDLDKTIKAARVALRGL